MKKPRVANDTLSGIGLTDGERWNLESPSVISPITLLDSLLYHVLLEFKKINRAGTRGKTNGIVRIDVHAMKP